MKYLKTFESIIYKNGDYILLSMTKTKWSTTPYKFAKVLRRDSKDDYVYLDALKKDTYESFNFWYNTDNIIRFLTPEEIKDFESKKDINKYNL